MSGFWPLLIGFLFGIALIGVLAVAPKQSVALLHPKE
jgi:uncharacterized membrane protein